MQTKISEAAADVAMAYLVYDRGVIERYVVGQAHIVVVLVK
jgi:hypothetical protein